MYESRGNSLEHTYDHAFCGVRRVTLLQPLLEVEEDVDLGMLPESRDQTVVGLRERCGEVNGLTTTVGATRTDLPVPEDRPGSFDAGPVDAHLVGGEDCITSSLSLSRSITVELVHVPDADLLEDPSVVETVQRVGGNCSDKIAIIVRPADFEPTTRIFIDDMQECPRIWKVAEKFSILLHEQLFDTEPSGLVVLQLPALDVADDEAEPLRGPDEWTVVVLEIEVVRQVPEIPLVLGLHPIRAEVEEGLPEVLRPLLVAPINRRPVAMVSGVPAESFG